jgi:rod shape-determining protein MreD
LKDLFFCLIFGSVSIVIQCCVLGKIFPMELKPDLTLLVVVWVGLKGDYMSGLFSAFFLGVMEDLLSGAPLGLFSFIYLVAYMFSAFVSVNFHVDQFGLSWLVAIVTSFISFCLVFLVRWLGGQVIFELAIIEFILIKTILTSLCLIIVKPLLDNSWRGYSRLIGAT